MAGNALHSELCDQVVFGIRAKTRALRNFDCAVSHRHGLGKWSRAEVGEHALERRLFFLCRHAVQHREKSRSDIKSIGHADGARLLDLGGYFRHGGDAEFHHGRLNKVSLADGDHAAKLAQAGRVLADPHRYSGARGAPRAAGGLYLRTECTLYYTRTRV